MFPELVLCGIHLSHGYVLFCVARICCVFSGFALCCVVVNFVLLDFVLCCGCFVSCADILLCLMVILFFVVVILFFVCW